MYLRPFDALCIYPTSSVFLSTVSTTPTHQQLVEHVMPQYATDWWNIGHKLDLADAQLRIIRYNHRNDVEGCCYVNG